jgi:hypothetical protein
MQVARLEGRAHPHIGRSMVVPGSLPRRATVMPRLGGRGTRRRVIDVGPTWIEQAGSSWVRGSCCWGSCSLRAMPLRGTLRPIPRPVEVIMGSRSSRRRWMASPSMSPRVGRCGETRCRRWWSPRSRLPSGRGGFPREETGVRLRRRSAHSRRPQRCFGCTSIRRPGYEVPISRPNKDVPPWAAGRTLRVSGRACVPDYVPVARTLLPSPRHPWQACWTAPTYRDRCAFELEGARDPLAGNRARTPILVPSALPWPLGCCCWP